MARYQVTMKDRTVEVIADADAYQQEGTMTTFFATGPGRQVVDCWSERVASFRTSEIIIIRRVGEHDLQPQPPREVEIEIEAGAQAERRAAHDDELVLGRGSVCRRDERGPVPFVVRENAS